MIRFMGFVTGAAVAIGVMLFLFGLPERPGVTSDVERVPAVESGAAPDTATVDATADSTDRGTPAAVLADAAVPPAATPEAPQPAPHDVMVAAPDVAPAEAPTRLAEPAPPADTQPARDATPAAVPTAPPVVAVADDAPPRELRWHAFWSPFASRIAADGFVGRLEAVTGFDYRVVQVDNGVYEVAFGYASDDERLTKLAAIEAATGLEMPDS